MESKGDEDTHQHPKWGKLTKHVQLPSTSSKASILTNPRLPQELITAILVRLPVKPLLQFKSVSKDWLSLISSPEFVKAHLSLSAKDFTRHGFLLRIDKCSPLEQIVKYCSASSVFNDSVTTEAFDVDYPLKAPNTYVGIVGSVNGLVCLAIGWKELIIWNPLVKTFKRVPNRMVMWYNYGFGYDEVRDDYKIVCIFCNTSYGYDAKIYSLKSDSWTRLEYFHGRVEETNSAKFKNGKLHWVTTDKVVMSIDMVDEKCGTVEQPRSAEGARSLAIGVLGSDFSVLYNYRRRYHYSYDLWVMKEYGVKESWTKLYAIKFPDEEIPVLSFHMSNIGDILLVYVSFLTIYNPKDDSIRDVEITEINSNVKVEAYIESLVCPILQNEPITI